MADWVKMFGEQLLTKEGLKATTEVLGGKEIVGIYFSAHWCPPCRGFTPKLKETYEKLVASGKSFEIVFVSLDRDDASFNGYYGEMPWVAIPFGNDQIKELPEEHGVSGIPAFVILKADGSVKNMEGRNVIAQDPDGAKFPWNLE